MRCGTCLVLALLLVGGASRLSAATPHLVKDIEPASQPESSSPHSFEDALPGLVFFTADDGQTGDQLWRSDGTPGGTLRLTDACPAGCTGGAFFFFVGKSPELYFFQVATFTSRELWVTDGTPGGTFPLAPAVQFPGFGVWMPSQKLLYFPMDDGVHGIELWRTDGTPTGTFQVTDLRPGPVGSNASELIVFNGKLFFQADDGRGPSLWASDGSPQGTRLVRTLAPSATVPDNQPILSVVGKTLLFSGPVPAHGIQLWRSDGTAKGTFTITSLKPQPGLSPFIQSVTVKNRLLFIANTHGAGQQLWTTDGTAKATQPLTNFHPKTGPVFGLSALFNNRLVFEADDGVHGIEYWTTDGTPRGTSLLKDLCPGACSGAGFEAIQSGNLLYLSGSDGVHGQELWVSNGTAAGTHMVADLCAGSCASGAFGIRPAGGFVYFVADDGKNGRQVWRSDGTAPGTLPLTASPFGFNENVQGIVLGSVLVFAAPETSHGTELWRSDGTPQGTGVLADIDPGDVGGSFPSNLTAVGSSVYFLAESGGEAGVWTSDGTAAGTVALDGPPQSPFNPFARGIELTGFPGSLFYVMTEDNESRPSLWHTDGTASGNVRLTAGDLTVDGHLTVVGNLVFFVAEDDTSGQELWVTDGTIAGTHQVEDLSPGSSGSSPRILTAFQGRLYFTVRPSDSSGNELWRSDGTAAGTVQVAAIDLGPSPTYAEHGGRLWFFASDENGTNLWSTDGSPAGTRAESLLPGPGDVNGVTMVWAGNRLFLYGTATDLGGGLFVWDGTPGNLRLLRGVGISQDPLYPPAAVASGGVLYFSGFDNTFQDALWASDGTEAGTRQVLDASGSPVFEPHYFQAFAGGVYFTNRENLLRTDGTSAGTVVVTRLTAPGESVFHELVAAGPRLFFRKWDPATGAELWALEAN